MSALVMAMLLTGAGALAEAQSRAEPLPMVGVPSPRPAPGARPPQPLRYDLNRYFTPADLPDVILRPGDLVSVGFSLAIGPDGVPTSCTVTDRSRYPALDAATCRVLGARARFAPALDGEGRPVAGTFSGGITWWTPSAPAVSVSPVPVPPPPPRATPAWRARANLGEYFGVDDYPEEALRARQEGIVGFELTTGTDTRVAGCRVTRSSGVRSLDEATCRILRQRARHTPARNAEGQLVLGRDSGRIIWRLPVTGIGRAGLAHVFISAGWLTPEAGTVSAADIPAGAPYPTGEGVSRLRIAVGRRGQVIGCDVDESSGSPLLDATACRLFSARASFAPARNLENKPVCDVTSVGINWRAAFAGHPRAPSGTPAPAIRPPRPLREQLDARLCPGWARG